MRLALLKQAFMKDTLPPMTVDADRLRTEALVMQQFTVEMEAGAMKV